MCGIAGQLKYDGRPADGELVKKMARLMAYRGPDGEGYLIKDRVALGMRRLKIIDLATGDQPIFNEDKTVGVVFNGEIYNFRELKRKLEAKGHKFYTKSDTETIVHAYEEYGLDFITHLDGMFAFALWDETEKRLVLARDRAGEKPLYYYFDGQQLLFASELKAILECPSIKKEIDAQALHYYMTFGRVPAPFSIFKGIKKLPPAHLLIAANGKIEAQQYWHLSFKDKLILSEEEIKKELVTRLEKAVGRMLVSDVPLGAFLSGGVDSSAVVAMMARVSGKPVETFSIGFKEADYSELKYAKMIADKYGTNHHEFMIEPDVMGVIPKLIWHLDEPFSDYSFIPTYYIARETRKSVTVALTGDGGDEVFAGYEWYKAVKIAARYNNLPRFCRELAYRFSNLFPDNDEREKIIRYIHKFKRLTASQRDGSNDPLEIYLSMTTGFTDELLRNEVYTDFMKEATVGLSAYKLRSEQVSKYDGPDPLEKLLFGQFRSLLPDMFFTKVDRCSMAASLETRTPLVDREFVEFTARIPFNLKLNGMDTKYIFKEALRGILPDEVLFRPKKGFTLPLSRWMKEGRLKDNIAAALNDTGFLSRGYFNREYVRKILAENNSGKANNTDRIWRLYTFALWLDTFMKK